MRRLSVAALVVAFVAFGAAGGASATEGRVRANIIAFGLYGDQDVFQSEASKAAAIVALHPGAADEVLILILSSHGSQAGVAVKSGAVTPAS